MKHLKLYLLMVLAVHCSVYAQSSGKLWGLTFFGGNQMGNIVSADLDGNNFKIEHSIKGTPLLEFRQPILMEVEPGVFYGTSDGGLNNRYGYFFRFDRDSNHIELLHEFGMRPPPNYMQEPYLSGGDLTVLNNKIYGTLRRGGPGIY